MHKHTHNIDFIDSVYNIYPNVDLYDLTDW